MTPAELADRIERWFRDARLNLSAVDVAEIAAALRQADTDRARLVATEADAEAGWKWAWSFDEWTEHGATGSLTDEARAEFQRDLAAHENREQP